MKRLILTLHRLNLDTALGIAITSVFVTRVVGAEVQPIIYITLFFSILAIYNFDHLVDARKIKGEAISPRHKFYQSNYKELSIYQLVLFLALIFFTSILPATIVKTGFVILLNVFIYFLFLFVILPKRFLFKEVMISTLFVAGVFIVPLAGNIIFEVSQEIILFGLQLFFLAMANTLIFAWLDYDQDAKEGHSSLAQAIGKDNTFRLSLGILVLLFTTLIYTYFLNTILLNEVIIGAMGSVLLLILLLKKKEGTSKELYRIAGEAIFLLPLIALI